MRQLIEQAHTHVASAANSAQTLLYWRVGERIRREVLGEARADYGEQIVSTLSTQLVRAYGQNFGLRSLRRMVVAVELMDLDSANIRVAQYLPALPDVQVLQAQLHRVLHRASRNQSLFVLRWSVV